jgi:hypothetical protein
MISLFTQQQQSGPKAYPFLASILIHATVIGLVSFVLLFAPKISMGAVEPRYIVRSVDLDPLQSQRRPQSGDSSMYPGPAASSKTSASPESQAAPPAASRLQLAKLATAHQTLLQPDIPLNKLIVNKTPLPSMLLWSKSKVRVQHITPPPPIETTSADVTPSIAPPNQESNLSDVQLSATPFTTPAPIPPPSNTTPIDLHRQLQVEHVPETTRINSVQPSPASVLSLSELNSAPSTALLPPANEIASGSPNGAMANGPNGTSQFAGKGDLTSHGTQPDSASGRGTAGQGRGKQGQSAQQAGAGDGKSGPGHASTPNGRGNAGLSKTTGAGQGTQRAGVNTGAAPGTESSSGPDGMGSGSNRPYVRISLPENGKFGVVVVGSTVSEQYPETAGIWSGRLTYSVYLHVGLAKSWILQYSLPRDADAAAAGNVVRIDAPWPYFIVRPDLDTSTIDADALMIHGFVNTKGQFESLSVVFPPEFKQEQYLLNALRQWQFRPAVQNDKPTRVEVLLVIPESDD